MVAASVQTSGRVFKEQMMTENQAALNATSPKNKSVSIQERQVLVGKISVLGRTCSPIVFIEDVFEKPVVRSL
jgi:hypothetical protein